ncbi:MAG: sigma-70 family RNA polymerase sigma factor [Myxococcota bacterium]|nr:sigma-70 family RNA polymerase sigma factor [Myxococcota bacterium]
MDDVDEQLPEPTADVIATLVAKHRELLAYVQQRVGDRALAEEILQDTLVRSLPKLDTIRDTAIGWFYRVLRNAIVDHQRKQASAARRLDALTVEQATTAEDPELHAAVCGCVGELAATLKPEYAGALRRIEVDGLSVKDYAAEVGITSNHAAVRVFRARAALRKQVARACGTCADHGCLDCSCARTPPSG